MIHTLRLSPARVRTSAARYRSRYCALVRTLIAVLLAIWLVGLANAQSAPANDHFANALPISGVAGSVTGSSASATREASEPNHAGVAAGHSVWYRWTAPQSGRAGFSTAGSSFDTLLAVYTGSGLNALTLIASNNDRLGETSIVALNAVAGVTYHVAVDGFADSLLGESGAVKLNWFPPPANDDFADAQEIRGLSGDATGGSVAAGKQPGEPNHAFQAGGASVWYRWPAPASGIFTFDTLGSNFDTLLAIYTGDSVNALTRIANNNNRFGATSSVTFRAAVGAVYHIAVDGAGGSFGNLILNWSPPAANDDFADARQISGAAGSLTDDNTGATRETGEPLHAGQTGVTSIWYRWTAPIAGSFTFTTHGSEINTLLAVYTGPNVGALTTIGSNNDDSRGRTTSIVTFNAAAGVTYRIAVDGLTGVTGAITLNWSRTPGNDLFASAQPISGAAGSVTGSNLAAFKEVGEPSHAGFPGGASVWYRWQAPASGPVTFSTAGSSLKALLAVYTGVSVNALAPVASGATERVSFNATAGVIYRIAVDGQRDSISGKTLLGEFTLNWSFGSRPANDNFSNAQLISGSSGSVTGSNALATEQAGEPNHAGFAAGASVWYRWTAPASGPFIFSTTGSDFKTVLAVYTGGSVAALTLAQADISSGPEGSSLVVFNAVSGTTYRIAVDGFSGLSRSTGSLKLNWSPAPANDRFVNAQPIGGRSGRIEGSTVGASKEDGEPFHAGDEGGASVWYRWIAPTAGPVSFVTTGSDFNTLLAVYTGSAINRLTTVARNDDRIGIESGVTFHATAGVIYRIAVDGRAGSSGDFTLRWFPSSIPANDDFADAQAINGASATVTGSNSGASREFFEPAHAGQTANSSVWYRWQAPASGRAVFTTLGSDFSARLAVYTGSGLLTLTAVASSGLTDTVTFNVIAGVTYHIAVDGQRISDVDSQQGALRLSFRMLPLSNDNFANARALDGGVGRVSDNSLGATLEAGEPAHADKPGGASLWYRWRAPSGGAATFTTAGSNFDTQLAVYTGGAVNALTPIASNDNFVLGTSSVTFTAAAGTTYFIAVAGRSGQTGLVRLAWNRGAPANDNLANAQTISGVDGAVGGHNANATKEAGEGDHAGNPGGRSIWYRWQAPTTGSVTFSTAGSNLDTVLAVYTGDSLSTLTPVASNDDDSQTRLTSLVNFQTVAGATYLIAVDGVGGRTGGIVLKWRVSSSISGRVLSQFVGISTDGVPFAPIILTGVESRTLTADAAGYYTIANLPPGAYTITAFAPGKIASGGFSIASRSFSPLNGDLEEIDLVVQIFSPAVTISGRVTGASGTGLPGIAVVLSGSASQTRTTGSLGGYSLPNLPVGGSFIVTPASANHSFTPRSVRLGNLAGDVLGANFTASAAFTISGKVTDHNGAPLSGVPVALIGSDHPPLETDADGNYSFTAPAGGDYTVAPALDNFVFTPSNPTFTNLSQHQKTVDFTGRQLFTISGRALLNGSGLGGVLVTLSGGQIASVMTDADGHYAFTGLPAGLNYVVTPSRVNLTFDPPSLAFDNLAGDQTGDFTAILPTVIIAAADASASEPGADTGAFTVARSGNIDAPLTIVYTISGAATNGVDYEEITGSVTLSAGAASATIPIGPKDDALVEGSETVTLTLVGSGDYVIGAQGEATVIIADNDPGSLTVLITAPANGESFADPANVTIMAEASTSGGAVSKVEFFAGETKLGEATVAPYSVAWLAVPAGAYVLTAKATDNQGNVVTSGPATITVGAKVTSVSAASYRGPALAQGSIVAAFGANLATETKVASPSNVGQDGILSYKSSPSGVGQDGILSHKSSQLGEPLPTTEAGSTVKVKDSLGTERLAPLFSISPSQVNYQIPPDTALGTATVTVTINDQVSAVGAVEITRTEPGLFSADGSGQGLPAAIIQRVKLDGTVTTEPVARYDQEQQRFVAAPIDLGLETDQVFLVLFGTGFRSNERGAECTIGGANAEVLFAGPQGVFVGLDQANVRLPRALIGRGEVEVLMTIAGKPANPMKIEVK